MRALKPLSDRETASLRGDCWELPAHLPNKASSYLPVLGAPIETFEWWGTRELVCVAIEAAKVLEDYGWVLSYCTQPSGLVYLQATHKDCEEEAVHVCRLAIARVERNSLKAAYVWQDDALYNVRALPAFVAYLISQEISHAD